MLRIGFDANVEAWLRDPSHPMLNKLPEDTSTHALIAQAYSPVNKARALCCVTVPESWEPTRPPAPLLRGHLRYLAGETEADKRHALDAFVRRYPFIVVYDDHNHIVAMYECCTVIAMAYGLIIESKELVMCCPRCGRYAIVGNIYAHGFKRSFREDTTLTSIELGEYFRKQNCAQGPLIHAMWKSRHEMWSTVMRKDVSAVRALVPRANGYWE